MKNRVWAFAIPAVILLAAFLVPSLLTSQSAVMDKPSKEDVALKMQRIQIPFVANKGQVDAQVKFYANTFGGTVFVTKEGEIVYSLPNNSSELGVESLKSDGRRQRSAARIQECRGELHSPSGISPLVRGDKGVCNTPPITNDRNETPPRPLLLEGRSGVALKEQFVGAKTRTIQGEEKSVTKVNYFKGNDSSKWKSNISTYDVVNLGEIYKGIELKLKAYGNNVEKLFCVKPDANPEQIKINLSGIQPSGNPPPLSPSVRGTGGCPPLAGAGGGLGARGLWVNEHGELVAETELGAVKFTKPIAYQEINGKRVDVGVEYRIQNPDVGWVKRSAPNKNGSKLMSTNPKSLIQNVSSTSIGDPKSKIANHKLEYGFKVASYDKSHDLIIDPLLASTYLGGSGSDYGGSGYSLALDTSGNVYMTGTTYWSDFPTTSGAYDTSLKNNGDVFVSKLNSGLTSLLASTYLGGSGGDYGYSLTLDTSGNVYVTGDTRSTDFPTTSGAYNTSYNGGNRAYYGGDVFVSKLDGGLTSLLASTYLGGSSDDWGYSLTLDTSGNVYVTGETYSTNFPTTSGAYNNNSNGSGFNDVFVSKLNGGLTSLLASTFLGVVSGVGGGYSLSLDTSGNVYVTGGTYSTNFPTTSGAYNTSKTGSGSDVFVSKLDGGLTSLLASTYLGGSGGDYGYSLTLDTSGNVYVTGETESSNFPTTNGAYNTSPNGDSDVFVSKLDSGLTSLLASTYLGGSGGDYRGSLAIDTSGNVYVTGSTGSSDFPTTSGSYENSRNITYSDVFVSKFNGGLTSLLASTYLGGSNYDWGYSLAIDTSGNVYVTGTTYSTDFPTTSGAYDTSQTGGGSNDVFVSKLDSSLSGSKPTATTGSSTNVTLSSATLNGTVNANGPSTTAWFNYGTSVGSYTGTSTTQSVSGSSDTLVSIGIGGLSPGTTYYYRIAAQNITGITYGDEMSFITLSDTSGSQGSISGYVIDIKGNPIGNAKVRLKRGNIAEKTASDEDGFFEFEDLDAGTYVVIVRKRRYKISRKTVKLKDNEDIEIEIKMKKQ